MTPEQEKAELWNTMLVMKEQANRLESEVGHLMERVEELEIREEKTEPQLEYLMERVEELEMKGQDKTEPQLHVEVLCERVDALERKKEGEEAARKQEEGSKKGGEPSRKQEEGGYLTYPLKFEGRNQAAGVWQMQPRGVWQMQPREAADCWSPSRPKLPWRREECLQEDKARREAREQQDEAAKQESWKRHSKEFCKE
jgi:hypothetical protein